MSSTRIIRREDFKGTLPELFSVSSSRLLRCYGPLLYLGMRANGGQQPAEEPRVFRSRIRQLLAAAQDQAKLLGCSKKQIEVARHAMIVFLDSAMLAQGGSYRKVWSQRSLEMESYGSVVGGHWFFHTLKTLLQARDGSNRDLIELFYLCLLSGFEGELRGRTQERERLLAQLHQELQSPGPLHLSRKTSLSTHTPAPRPPGYLKWIPLVASVLFLFVLGGLSLSILIWQVSTTNTRMDTIALAEEQ